MMLSNTSLLAASSAEELERIGKGMVVDKSGIPNEFLSVMEEGGSGFVDKEAPLQCREEAST